MAALGARMMLPNASRVTTVAAHGWPACTSRLTLGVGFVKVNAADATVSAEKVMATGDPATGHGPAAPTAHRLTVSS
eukprot:6475939-Pyramimonas_sp.AAC.1